MGVLERVILESPRLDNNDDECLGLKFTRLLAGLLGQHTIADVRRLIGVEDRHSSCVNRAW